jgi:two-component sensor histidine kinase
MEIPTMKVASACLPAWIGGKSRSMGLRLVQMLVTQLNATVAVSNSDGTQYAISFANITTQQHEEI